MHPAAYQWVADHVAPTYTVLDIGGRNINGSPRDLFSGSEYIAIDLYPGNGVDITADITQWETEQRFGVVLCCEVLEHVEGWRAIIDAAHRLCADGGLLILTAAGPGRKPHSAYDGGHVRPDEWYANIEPDQLTDALAAWSEVVVDVTDDDIRATARR